MSVLHVVVVAACLSAILYWFIRSLVLIDFLLTSCFCSLIMVITVRWQLAVMVPPTTHHLSGSGSMAYGTNITKRMYHMRYSRSANPTPSPTKPAKETGVKSNAVIQHGVLWAHDTVD